jgi:uncharacterized peroxidase-related enzyme
VYLTTIAETDATGEVARIYAESIAHMGFVMEADRCLTTRPDLLPLVQGFIDAARGRFSLGLRAWRLITLIAAKEIPSTYCSYVYGKQLVGDLGSKEKLLAVQQDFRRAGLPDKEVAMLAYAQQVARDASKISERDIDGLRRHGFTDIEISDIALCASFRCFLSRFYDAVGASPEPLFFDETEPLREALTVGRRFPAPGD